MSPKITPTDATLGATVTDVSLAELDDATWQTIENAFLEYGVLIFPAQHLSSDDQVAFGHRFGVIEQIVPTLEPHKDDLVLLKEEPSAFFGTQLQSILNHHRTDTLVITGMSTSGCVRATVVDAFSLNYKCVIPIECVADSRRVSGRWPAQRVQV